MQTTLKNVPVLVVSTLECMQGNQSG
ncbi:hypothetical protein JMJ77_0003673 [Colletotrichum scovillei]|uniref:Uncharacterized protein n=1 Tax=Colletotrichum scovillei TaxID=1209932 RepID=A0A9P7QWH3_9PEZI|nr:hypothetical protein JMJ78_0005186 [Colletotrichum scovillei]KAG7041571.1 hypothetical protein JMJ77_0003673 [Colletotrichum scovillei]KAG7061598.1 hypothetical protein JMJ76_0001158 [Colletotrichum scovillei]